MTKCEICGKRLPMEVSYGGNMTDWGHILCDGCFYKLKEGDENGT